MTLGITRRQLQLLQYVEDCISRLGYPPTMREIGDQMGITSVHGVFCHLTALKRKGLVETDANKARALRLTERGYAAVEGGKDE